MTEVKRGRPPKKDTVTCVVVRDFWVTADDRKRAGTIVELPVEEAMDKVEAGIVSRYKADD